MSESSTSAKPGLVERFARRATEWTGSTWAFTAAVLLIVVWAFSRPLFDSIDTWQLVINTGTTIITFLMVFLIQRGQNKDAHAVHIKLNELVAAMKGASNRLIAVEDLSEAEMLVLTKHFQTLVEKAKQEASIGESHSVEEAEARHSEKQKG